MTHIDEVVTFPTEEGHPDPVSLIYIMATNGGGTVNTVKSKKAVVNTGE